MSRFGDRAQDVSRVAQEPCPVFEQVHPLGRSVEEGCTQLFLERSDLAGEGGLRDVQSRRCAADMTFLRHGYEVLQLGEAHEGSLTPDMGQAKRVRRSIPKWYWHATVGLPDAHGMGIDIFGGASLLGMRRAGAAAARTLAHVGARLCAGMSTAEIDILVRKHTQKLGGVPSQLGYQGFPAALCTSVNDVVCHGIPSRHCILREGDIVNLDVTTCFEGFHGDNSAMFLIGRVTPEAAHVVDVSRRCLEAGIAAVRDGARLGDIGFAIETLAEREGCSVVRDFGGHGIGRAMHCEPSVAHHGRSGRGQRLRAGQCITIEPMINLGGHETTRDLDGWTIRTADGSLSAQWEHTLLVTQAGADVLTCVPADSQRPLPAPQSAGCVAR